MARAATKAKAKPAAKKKPAPQMDDAATTLKTLHDDPVLFVRTCLNAQPQQWQMEALRAIGKHDRVAIRSGHGVGKSAFLSWVILWWLLTHYPAKIAATANTAHQLSDVLWAELQKWIKHLPEGFQKQLEIKSDKINLVSAADSFCVARTSRKEQPEALQGFHSPNMLFVCDEASGIPDIVFEVGQGSMSTPGAKTLMVGNPTRGKGFFSDAFKSERWNTHTVSCLDSPQVSEDFIEQMAEQYGADSNIYRVRVLGLPPESDDDAVIPRHLVESATTREVEAIETVMPIWGLDVARMGGDRSALCKRRGNVVTEPIKTWRDKDLMQLCGIVLSEYEATPYPDRPSEIVIDSIGLGAGVVDRLVELDLPARGINVAESSSMGQKFVRLRDELWWLGREWLEKRDCLLPQQDDLTEELTLPRFVYTSAGKLKVESKDEMRKRGRKSPDVADAFLLTFAGNAARVAGGNAWRYNRPLTYGDSSWIV